MCSYLLYSSCHITSKAFINDVTEIRPYSLLLFGNNLDVNYVNGVVEIDSWIRCVACNIHSDIRRVSHPDWLSGG